MILVKDLIKDLTKAEDITQKVIECLEPKSDPFPLVPIDTEQANLGSDFGMEFQRVEHEVIATHRDYSTNQYYIKIGTKHRNRTLVFDYDLIMDHLVRNPRIINKQDLFDSLLKNGWIPDMYTLPPPVKIIDGMLPYEVS